MDAGKPCPLGKQPGRSDSKCFPPILGRKASWSSFLRNSPNSRNGALLGGQSWRHPISLPHTALAGLLPAALWDSPLHPNTLQPLCFPSLAVLQPFLPKVCALAALGQLQRAGGRRPGCPARLPRALTRSALAPAVRGAWRSPPGVAGRERSCARPPGS